MNYDGNFSVHISVHTLMKMEIDSLPISKIGEHDRLITLVDIVGLKFDGFDYFRVLFSYLVKKL